MYRMNRSSLLLPLFFSVTVCAQTTFTANSCFQTGDSSKLGFNVSNRPFEELLAMTGDNEVWDFSAEAWPAPSGRYVFRPASESGTNGFSHSEINEYGTGIYGRHAFYTYSADKDTLYLDGFFTSIPHKYTPRIPYLSFPLNFGDSTWTRTLFFGNPNQPSNATGSSTRYWIYDGFGTVKMPFGVSGDCFRIHMKQIDSTFVLNSANVYEEIIWFGQNRIPVLHFMKNGTMTNVWYAEASQALSSVEPGFEQVAILFPNPTQTGIQIQGPSKSRLYRMSDLSGRTCMHGSLVGGKATVDLSGLEAGVYLVSFEGSLQTVRLLKQ